MNVKAAPGLKCPMEGKPRQYITDSTAVTVQDTPYYRRMVREGSLVQAPVPEDKAKKNKGGDQ
jgi:hypothetical protein